MSDQPNSNPQIVHLQAQAAEETVVGTLLIAPDQLRFVRAIVPDPAQFWNHRLREIYQVMIDLAEAGETIDFAAVQVALADRGKLDMIGGPAELTRLLTVATVPSAIETHARKINEMHIRRQVAEAANALARMAFNRAEPVQQDTAIKTVRAAFDEVAAGNGPATIAEAMRAQGERMERVASGEITATPTGFRDVDGILAGGAMPGDFVVIAGRPGSGKTAYMLDIVKHACEREQPQRAAVFSLEMPGEQIAGRLISKVGQIDGMAIKRGVMTAEQWERYYAAQTAMESWPLAIDDTPGIRPEQLRAKIARLMPLDLVIVDYLQLMETVGFRPSERVAAVSYISRQLKLIAREFGVVLIAGAQLNRAVEKRGDGRPILSDLRESGAIEQDADIVIFLHRPELYNNNPELYGIAEAIIAKHRNGAVGSAPLVFRKSYAQFGDAAKNTIDLTTI